MAAVQVLDLSGKALAWAVASCHGWRVEDWHPGCIAVLYPGAPRAVPFQPDRDWSQAGPILQDNWQAIQDRNAINMEQHGIGIGADDVLAGLLRCYVGSVRGDWIEVPFYLVESAKPVERQMGG